MSKQLKNNAKRGANRRRGDEAGSASPVPVNVPAIAQDAATCPIPVGADGGTGAPTAARDARGGGGGVVSHGGVVHEYSLSQPDFLGKGAGSDAHDDWVEVDDIAKGLGVSRARVLDITAWRDGSLEPGVDVRAEGKLLWVSPSGREKLLNHLLQISPEKKSVLPTASVGTLGGDLEAGAGISAKEIKDVMLDAIAARKDAILKVLIVRIPPNPRLVQAVDESGAKIKVRVPDQSAFRRGMSIHCRFLRNDIFELTEKP